MSGIIAQNTLLSSGLIKAPEGGGAWNFLSKQTASASSTLSFTSGIDSTYKEYVFTWIDMHPSETDPTFSFQVDTGTNTSYNQTITSSSFYAQNREDDNAAQTSVGYIGGGDQAQGTAFQALMGNIINDNDGSTSGFLHLFNPSGSTYVKHFYSQGVTMENATPRVATLRHLAGYVNTTTALTRVQFKFSSGDMDTGDVVLYGISS